VYLRFGISQYFVSGVIIAQFSIQQYLVILSRLHSHRTNEHTPLVNESDARDRFPLAIKGGVFLESPAIAIDGNGYAVCSRFVGETSREPSEKLPVPQSGVLAWQSP
jgi:hypothetical protein